MVRTHRQFQAIQSDCNKNSGEESMLSLMPPHNWKKKCQNYKIAILAKPSRSITIENYIAAAIKNRWGIFNIRITWTQDKVKGVNLRNCQKFKLQIFHKTQYATHPLKLVDMIRKYEMDLASIVEDTEQTRFCPQTDRQTDKLTHRQTSLSRVW